MALIDDADVQTHLPIDLLKVEAVPDDRASCKLDAERIVRGHLTGVIDSAVLASWATPATTPETIRAIAGRLCAALIYRLRFSQIPGGDPEYAQNKYNEAMLMLMDIVNGNVELPDIDNANNMDDSWFWPNNTTDPPKFTMADQY